MVAHPDGCPVFKRDPLLAVWPGVALEPEIPARAHPTWGMGRTWSRVHLTRAAVDEQAQERERALRICS